MRRYETVFITYADLPEEEINSLLERYSAVIKGGNGTVVKVEKWGKRKLAYEINKQTRGYYALIDFAGSASIVAELERNLRIGDRILKFMTVKTQETVNLQDLEKEMASGVVEEKAEQAPPPDQEKPAIQDSADAAYVETAAVAASENEAPAPEPADEEEVK